MYFKAIDNTLIMMYNVQRLNGSYRSVKYTVYRGVWCGWGRAWGSFCSNCSKQNIDDSCLWCRQCQCFFFLFWQKEKWYEKQSDVCFLWLCLFNSQQKDSRERVRHHWFFKDKPVNWELLDLIPGYSSGLTDGILAARRGVTTVWQSLFF